MQFDKYGEKCYNLTCNLKKRKVQNLIMGKKGVLSTLRFVLITAISLVMIFTAVYLTVLNTYKPAVKAYINGEFIGYFSDEQQFDEVYNDLVAEKQNIDENVKVYLESEPTFEQSYIRDSLLEEQNVYTNLRAEIKTEYTIYELMVDGEQQMTFTAEEQAENYIDKLKAEVEDVDTTINVEKVSELENITSTERADTILADIVDRNKPVEIPVEEPKVTTPQYATTVYTGVVTPAVDGTRVWPTAGRNINCDYWGYYGHNGVDIGGASGTPIYAFMGGTVTFSGWDSTGYGYCVKINHGNGLVTIYAHCSALYVSAGQQVAAGETLGGIGMTGWATGNHLHFEIKVNGVSVNPWIYLSGV